MAASNDLACGDRFASRRLLRKAGDAYLEKQRCKDAAMDWERLLQRRLGRLSSGSGHLETTRSIPGRFVLFACRDVDPRQRVTFSQHSGYSIRNHRMPRRLGKVVMPGGPLAASPSG